MSTGGLHTRKREAPPPFDNRARGVGRMRGRRGCVTRLAGSKLLHDVDPVEVGAQAAACEGRLHRFARRVFGTEGASYPRIRTAIPHEAGKQTRQAGVS